VAAQCGSKQRPASGGLALSTFANAFFSILAAGESDQKNKGGAGSAVVKVAASKSDMKGIEGEAIRKYMT